MREIEFRGKTVDRGEWVHGWYLESCFGRWPLLPSVVPIDEARDGYHHAVEVDPATVGQFTGLTDKNGNRIYEGDLVNIPGSSRQGLPGEVHWYSLSCMFSIRRKGYNPVLLDGDTVYEVVGNIYDNPDMLK